MGGRGIPHRAEDAPQVRFLPASPMLRRPWMGGTTVRQARVKRGSIPQARRFDS